MVHVALRARASAQIHLSRARDSSLLENVTFRFSEGRERTYRRVNHRDANARVACGPNVKSGMFSSIHTRARTSAPHTQQHALFCVAWLTSNSHFVINATLRRVVTAEQPDCCRKHFGSEHFGFWFVRRSFTPLYLFWSQLGDERYLRPFTALLQRAFGDSRLYTGLMEYSLNTGFAYIHAQRNII